MVLAVPAPRMRDGVAGNNQRNSAMVQILDWLASPDTRLRCKASRRAGVVVKRGAEPRSLYLKFDDQEKMTVFAYEVLP